MCMICAGVLHFKCYLVLFDIDVLYRRVNRPEGTRGWLCLDPVLYVDTKPSLVPITRNALNTTTSLSQAVEPTQVV